MWGIIIIGIQPLGRFGQRPELSQSTGVYFSIMYPMKVPVQNIHSCITIRVMQLVNQPCLNMNANTVEFLYFCWWRRHYPVLCKSNQNFAWKRLSSCTNFILFTLSVCFQRVALLSSLEPLARKYFHLFVKCCPFWNSIWHLYPTETRVSPMEFAWQL